MNQSAFLLSLFDEAVRVADPMICVPTALPPKPDKLLVIGAGKASARMAEAVEEAWGPCDGLIITRYGYERPLQGLKLRSAAHPVPDQAGVEATRELRALLETADEDTFVLALISGGGSALMIDPAGDVTLEDKQAVNQSLLACGAPITQMNLVRKHLSRVKGGQLAAAAYPAKLLALMISDVPGDDPAFIASGPTVGDASTPSDARSVIDCYAVSLPASAKAVLDSETGVVPPGDERLSKTTNQVIAAPSQSLAAAKAIAEKAGIAVTILGDALEGEARELGQTHARQALKLQSEITSPVLLLSGGECTVTRTGDGAGGPNAEYALSLAVALDGTPDIHAIACDTDGVDGAPDTKGHEVAGALVTPQTLERAKAQGLSAADYLSRNDAHSFFREVEGQVTPGPTLTNVNDFRAILIEAQS